MPLNRDRGPGSALIVEHVASLGLNSRPVRIETIPLIIGVLIALLGIGIMFDAWTPDTMVAHERRRRPRIERHRNGEAMIGLGVLALAAAFIGRDNWSYSTLVVIIGALFLVVGTVLNARYVRDLFVNRGPLRRREESEQGTELIGANSQLAQRRRTASAGQRDECAAAGLARGRAPKDATGQQPR